MQSLLSVSEATSELVKAIPYQADIKELEAMKADCVVACGWAKKFVLEHTANT